MATKLESQDGELLWSPNDFGTYSAEKVQLITTILSGLLSNLTLNMNTKVDEESLSNIYTISQTHEKFLEKENAAETISMAVTSVLQSMYSEGSLVSPATVDTLRTFVSNLYDVCYGLSLDGTSTPSSGNSYNRQIESIRLLGDSNSSSILQLQRNVFGSYPDGSVNTSVLSLASVKDVGDISDLDKGITDRDNIVEAVNYIARNNSSVGGNVSSLNSRLSSVENDVRGLDSDVNGLESDVSDLKSNLNRVDSSVASLTTRVSSAETRIGVNEGNISNMRSELTAVESDIKTLQTNIGDKNSLTTSEKSSIVSAINSLVMSVNSIRTSLTAIEDRLIALEKN